MVVMDSLKLKGEEGNRHVGNHQKGTEMGNRRLTNCIVNTSEVQKSIGGVSV